MATSTTDQSIANNVMFSARNVIQPLIIVIPAVSDSTEVLHYLLVPVYPDSSPKLTDLPTV